MMKFMRILFKIMLAPFVMLFSFAIFLFDKIFGLVAGIAMMLSVMFAIFGVIFIFNPVYNWSVIPTFLTAFLLSPMGIPLIGGILLVTAENLRDWLKAI